MLGRLFGVDVSNVAAFLPHRQLQVASALPDALMGMGKWEKSAGHKKVILKM